MSSTPKIRLMPASGGRRQSPRITIPGILDNDAFLAHLETERRRVDRSNKTFTLVVFRLAGVFGQSQRERAEQVLLEVLNERTRACDAKGWHGANPALVLPYTAKEQASNLIESITALFRDKATQVVALPPGAQFTCDIYGYPEDNLDTIS